MSIMHCPLCIGLAVMSVVRAAMHLGLVSLRLVPVSSSSQVQAQHS